MFGRSMRRLSSSPASGRVYRVVLTGGPCAGKTTSLERLVSEFRGVGFRVLTTPEVATLMTLGGCQYPGEDGGEALVRFEGALLSLQRQVEESFCSSLPPPPHDTPTLVVHDRGLLDPSAYVRRGDWEEVLRRLGWEEEEIASHYDGVVHLTTAAIGAEAFYKLDNNAARTESPQQAAELDLRVESAWKANHARVKVVRNTFPDFEGKVQAALQAVKDIIRETDAEEEQARR